MALHEHRIISVKPLNGFIVECGFDDGSIRQFDVAKFADRYPFYKPVVEDVNVFRQVEIILGGDAIAWDEMRDLSSEGIYCRA
ncbi:MAG: DUF2442 domain-containing protein [Coriobacteriales bacterium]|jgi:hypothetical protein|nr:DUF2442 domain-containing protein [Coriobacteriales bacterium]